MGIPTSKSTSTAASLLLLNLPEVIDPTIDFQIGLPVHLAILGSTVQRIFGLVEVLDLALEEKNGFDSELILRKTLRERNWTAIGITCHSIRSAVVLRKVVPFIKSVTPSSIIIVGGVNATFSAKWLADFVGPIDYVIRGYGQVPFLELSKSIVQGTEPADVPGVYSIRSASRDALSAGIINVKTFAEPNLTLLDTDRYLRWTKTYPIVTHTGCNYACNFCTSVLPQNGRLKEMFRPVEDVIAEMNTACRVGFNNFFFADNTFTSQERYVSTLCDLIVREGISDVATWMCMTRVDAVNREILSKMKNSGCVSIAYGVESGSINELNLFEKKIKSAQEIYTAFRWTKEIGISSTAFLIIGSPYQTEDDLWNTVQLVEEIKPDYRSINFFQPFPGTIYFEEPLKYGLQVIKQFDRWSLQGGPTCLTKHFDERHLVDFAVRLLLVGRNGVSGDPCEMMPGPFRDMSAILHEAGVVGYSEGTSYEKDLRFLSKFDGQTPLGDVMYNTLEFELESGFERSMSIVEKMSLVGNGQLLFSNVKRDGILLSVDP